MKKICVLLAAIVCCGCSSASNSISSNDETVTTIENTILDEYVDAAVQEYNLATMEELIDSPIYDDVVKNDCVLLYPKVDDSKYTLYDIEANELGGWYAFYFIENETGKSIIYDISYGTKISDIEEFSSNHGANKTIMATAESGGNTYEVCLTTTTFDQQENYVINFIPEDNYFISLRAGNASTTDEILQYFPEFELVAYAE